MLDFAKYCYEVTEENKDAFKMIYCINSQPISIEPMTLLLSKI